MTLLARRSRALKRHLGAAAAGDGRGVHRARVASRRLREALPVLASGLEDTKARKAWRQLRRLTRALGGVREIDVTVALIDELGGRAELPRVALEQVRALVVGEREARQAVLAKRLDPAKTARLDRRLGFLHDALRDSESERWRAALAKRLVKRSKRLREAIRGAGTIYEPERLHRVRLSAKKLRYAIELAADAGIGSAARPVRELERVQDVLGRLHDLQVLQVRVAAVQAQPASAMTPDAGLERIAGSLEEECRHLHARYLGLIPLLLAVLDAVQRAVLPELLRKAVRATPPLKMDLEGHRPAARRRAVPGAAVERS